MRRALFSMLLAVSSLASASADAQDEAGSRAPALFTRMKGFSISRYEVKDLGRFEFPVAADRKEAVEPTLVESLGSSRPSPSSASQPSDTGASSSSLSELEPTVHVVFDPRSLSWRARGKQRMLVCD